MSGRAVASSDGSSTGTGGPSAGPASDGAGLDGAASAARGESAPGLLFVNQHYWPDVASTGQHLTDLAEHLADRGFEVEVLTSRARYEGGEVEAPAEETRRGVRIRRTRVPGFGRVGGPGHVGRVLDYLAFFVPALLRVLLGPRRDAVVCLTTPPLLPALGLLARLLRGQPYGIWSMDLHPETEEALGIFDGDARYAGLLRRLSDASYRRAEFVVDLGPVMKRRIEGKGVDPGRLRTIPVWNDADRVRPVPKERNPLVGELGLDGRFVVMYSGNAGLGHRFREVLEAMDRLSGRPDLFFLFVGDGPRRPEIEEFARRRGIENFAYRDYVPRERLARSLSVADLHLITLRPSMAGIAAPGKLYGILAAGRPALMVGPEESEPGLVIREHGVGEVVDPARMEDGEGAEAVVEVVLRARERPGRCREVGRRAREVFEERFSADVARREWEEMLREEVGTDGGG